MVGRFCASFVKRPMTARVVVQLESLVSISVWWKLHVGFPQVSVFRLRSHSNPFAFGPQMARILLLEFWVLGLEFGVGPDGSPHPVCDHLLPSAEKELSNAPTDGPAVRPYQTASREFSDFYFHSGIPAERIITKGCATGIAARTVTQKGAV